MQDADGSVKVPSSCSILGTLGQSLIVVVLPYRKVLRQMQDRKFHHRALPSMEPR